MIITTFFISVHYLEYHMKKAFLLFALITLLALTACSGIAPSKGEVLVYIVVPLSGWQANGGQ